MSSVKENLETSNKRQFGWWARYYDNFFYWVFFKKVYKKLIEIFDDNFGNFLSLKIVDVACGTGEIIFRLASKHPNFNFYGVDLTPAMVLTAKNKNNANKNVVIFEGNVERLPVDNEAMDILICSDAFHHFYDPKDAANEFARVLKKNGKVLLVDPEFRPGFKGKITDFFGRLIDSYNKLYSASELVSIFSAAGFRVVKREMFYFNTFWIFEKA